ncbi:hypothetical protein E5D57_007224 [Metarhizium anisopliae]|nr:hypothetical protein E5D57_007224 [Metarhizium anisopliae]
MERQARKEDALVDALRAEHIIHQVFAVQRLGASSEKCFFDVSRAECVQIHEGGLGWVHRAFSKFTLGDGTTPTE